jgi:hypothetical protein
VLLDADLTGAWLCGADLSGARLTDARVDGTDLTGAIGVRHLSRTQLRRAVGVDPALCGDPEPRPGAAGAGPSDVSRGGATPRGRA